MKVVVNTESETLEVLGTFSHVDEDVVAYHEWGTGLLGYAPEDCVIVTEGRRMRDGLVATGPIVKITVANPDTSARRTPGRSTIEIVADAKKLTDERLAEAIFYAEIRRRDAGSLTTLRREAMRRALTAGDAAAVEKLVRSTMYDALSALFCDTSLRGDGGFEGNSEDADVVLSFDLPGERDFSLDSAASYF